MNYVNHLAEVMLAEAELTERLVEVMHQQQSGIVKIDPDAVEKATELQEELLLPIEGLEQERARLTREVWNAVSKQQIDKKTSITLSSLIAVLEDDDRKIISEGAGRLQRVVTQLTQLNQANQYLIEHSRKFVHETFKIVTNGFSRQLIDQKI